MVWRLFVAGFVACAADKPAADTSAAGTGDSCPIDTLAVGEVQVLATGFDVDGTEGTEGLAFSPDGRLFVGGSGVKGDGYVAEIQRDGAWSVVADVPGSVGLAWQGDRMLVAVSDAGDGTGGLVAVDPDSGEVEVRASGISGSNFPAVTPWGTVLVSSPSGGTLWEVRDGAVSAWAEGVPSPNGIAFSPDGAMVYVANTYATPSTVASIPVTGDSAGAVGVLATLPDGSTQDGVAMDAAGNLYVVNNLPGTIARITPDGTVTTLAEGVAFGASLAFGEGAWDPCSLYVSSLFSPDVFRVGVGAPGALPFR